MMRCKVVISGLLLVLAATLALAQEKKGLGGRFGGMGFGGPMGGMPVTNSSLLAIPDVQKELGVSDEQKKELADVQKQMRAAFAGFNFRDMQSLSQEEREKRFAETRKKGEEANKAADEKIAKILDAKQLERLGQLRLQRQGVMALTRSEVAKDLGLTEEQQAKIKKIQEDARPQGRGPFGGPGAQPPSQEEMREMFARMQKQREKMQADLLAVLTDEQKAKWSEMKGKEFKFPQPSFGGFGGGERKRPPVKKPAE
jgi:Spy/CpxP family protein refolding chaperone